MHILLHTVVCCKELHSLISTRSELNQKVSGTKQKTSRVDLYLVMIIYAKLNEQTMGYWNMINQTSLGISRLVMAHLPEGTGTSIQNSHSFPSALYVLLVTFSRSPSPDKLPRMDWHTTFNTSKLTTVKLFSRSHWP